MKCSHRHSYQMNSSQAFCRRLSQSLLLALMLPLLSGALSWGAQAIAAEGAQGSQGPKEKRLASLSLADEMKDLGNSEKLAAPERMYIVQDRAVGLGGRFEASVGAAKNFNSNIYINSTENSGMLTYHIDDRFYTSLYGSSVSNQLTKSGEKAWKDDGIYPNTAFVKRRFDGTVGFNLVYGKARITREAMFYFDQYLAIGGGVVDQSDGEVESRVPSMVGDVGFALWFGPRLSVRLGVKDHYFEERRTLDSSRVHHMLGYSSLGFMLGGAG